MRYSHLFAFSLLLAGGAAAYADTIQNFTVSAVLDNNAGMGGSVSGSITTREWVAAFPAR